MPIYRLLRTALFPLPDSEWWKHRGRRNLVCQTRMKDVTKRLGGVGAVRLSGWGPCDTPCTWLETLNGVAANRCQ
ncbi:polyprotein [Clonorchis sinensis]|uniref:Polyprotein n=1 Tax=Clonorchis sinensis TaxID=79923 RepID=G7YWG6_CLOSI|nr:polyprotein [Clonorchis sinensis]